MKRPRLFWLAPILISFACAAPASSDDQPRPAVAPLLGKADSTDLADRECRVVLRKVERLVGSRGVGVAVTIDVADPLLASPGATPGVTFRADGAAWQEVTAYASDGAPAGFHRFVARLSVAVDAELVAFARTTTGVRLFDHNRLAGDFQNFHVDASNGFAIAESAATCPGLAPLATLEFRGDFSQAQHGAILDGGKLSVAYELARLTTCRDTHNGYRFWTLDAFARFSPGGELVTGTVVASNGAVVSAVPFTTDVPAGATSVELWFRNASPPSCEAWDSAYGANYRFAVVSAAPPPVGWAGNLGGSLARDCAHRDGLAEPVVIDEYVRERACAFVDAEVWIPSVTDAAAPLPEWIAAQLEWVKDAQPPAYAWAEDAGRAGNNRRYRWTVPYELRNLADWTDVKFAFRFSTDGRAWFYPEGGARRTIHRAFQLP